MSYVIIKHVVVEGKELPVLLVDEQNEVMSFGHIEDAKDYKNLFQVNSDSNHRYEIKKVHEK